jgi:hypothetical protein
MTAGSNLYTLVYEGRSGALQEKGWGRLTGTTDVAARCRLKIVIRETTDVTDCCWHDVGKINRRKSTECQVCRRRCLLVECLDDATESNSGCLDRYRNGIDNNNNNQSMWMVNREGTNKGLENVRLYPSPKRQPTKVQLYVVDNKPQMGA